MIRPVMHQKIHKDPTVDAVEQARAALTKATLDQRKATAKAMARRDMAGTLRMMRAAIKRTERIIDKMLTLVPPPRFLACKAGCPWCCHIRLTASPPEVLLVLKHIRETFNDDEITRLKKKVANIDRYTRGKDGETRAKQRLPCPLLKDDSCSVHSVRPLSCRAVVSVDVQACKKAYESRMEEPVPHHEWQYQAANGIGYGLHAGLMDAGFPLEDVEMNAALAIGLDDPEIGQRWLEGEDVFAPATVVRSSDQQPPQ